MSNFWATAFWTEKPYLQLPLVSTYNVHTCTLAFSQYGVIAIYAKKEMGKG